jgi:hypothetical protein
MSSLDDIRHCATITGNLTLNPSADLRSIEPADLLPYLTRVEGQLSRSQAGTNLTDLLLPELEHLGALVLNTDLDSAIFPKLTTVGPYSGSNPQPAVLYMVGGAVTVEMPELQTITGGLGMSSPLTTRLHLPRLATVTGDFDISWFIPQLLSDANFSRVEAITGNLILENLCRLPYSSVSRLESSSIVSGSRTVANIGCCVFGDSTSDCDATCEDEC